MTAPPGASTPDLYNAAIVAEAKATAGAGRLAHPSVSVVCDNPLCGDRVGLDLAVEGGRVAAAGHVTRGCLLTRAAASLVTRHLDGRDLAELPRLRGALEAVLAGAAPPADWPEIGMFTPVAAVRSRHDCVLLPIRAVERALAALREPVP
jgi:nitrogen fixation NifU-like protein